MYVSGLVSLRPVRGDAEHRRAIAVAGSLLDRSSLSPDQEDDLDVPGLIIGDDGASIDGHPEFSPLGRLRLLMDEHGLSQAAPGRRAGVGPPGNPLSDVFAGKRG